MNHEGDQTRVKSTDDTANMKPAEVPESQSSTDIKTNPASSIPESIVIADPQESKAEEDIEVDGEHVEGDDDSVLW